MFMMYPHYYQRGFFGLSVFPIFLILGVILLIWVLTRDHSDTGEMLEEETALEILKRRYARGELTKREFLEMKKDIQ